MWPFKISKVILLLLVFLCLAADTSAAAVPSVTVDLDLTVIMSGEIDFIHISSFSHLLSVPPLP